MPVKEAERRVTGRALLALGLGSALAANLSAELRISRSASIQSTVSGIENECRLISNGDWRKYYEAAKPVQKELNGLVAEAFRNPRPSRVRTDKLALLRSRSEPVLFTAAGDCLHSCLFDFQHPDQPLAPET